MFAVKSHDLSLGLVRPQTTAGHPVADRCDTVHWGVSNGLIVSQSPEAWLLWRTLTRQDGCVCSDTLLVLVHPKTTHVLYEQPSVVCPWTGIAHLASNDWPRPPAAQSRPQLGVEAFAGPFQVAKTRHQMMMVSHRRICIGANMFHICCLLSVNSYSSWRDNSILSRGIWIKLGTNVTWVGITEKVFKVRGQR